MATVPSLRPTRIVVVAFGPADITSDAHRRAARFVADGGDVVVVAAHRGAALDAATPVGAQGLAAVLESTDGPVLLLHDDITIGRDGVAALLRAWHATGQPAVPWTNVPGTDHHVDAAIPVDDDARSRLARRLPLGGGPAAVTRPVCMVADAGVLRRACDRFLTVADTIWSDPEVEVVIAANALAHHSGRCAAATPSVGSTTGPLLVAGMIVRDEATRLPDCLASLEGLVDRVEICDTGSTDDTVAVATSLGASVIHRPWRNDFAEARNHVLDRCRDAAYVLQIDADERARCDDPEAVRRRLALLADSVRVMSVAIDNVDERGRIGSTHDAARVLRPDGVVYRGALHERPSSTDGTRLISLQLQSLRLEHHGYQHRVVAERGKSDRNVAISRRAYEETPNWETAFQYARSLGLGNRDDERIAGLLHETLRGGEQVPVTWRAWALAKLARDALRRDEDEAAVDLAQQALQLVPADPVAGAVLTEAAQRLGRSDVILAQRDARRSTVSPKPFSMLSDARARVAGAEIAALLELGATDDAYDEAAAALRADPDHFAAWPALVRSVAGAGDVEAVDELLASAALADGSGDCIAAIAHGLEPGRAARICVRYLQRGGTELTAVRNGIVTALVAGAPDVVDQLLADGHRLEPAVLAHLASAATQRGMDRQAEHLATLATLPRRPFVVCAAGRSGIEYTSRALTALGHPCGHEAVFTPFTSLPEFGAQQGDASWLALPHLDDLPADAVIFHQVRDPLQVLRSLIDTHLLTARTPYLDFIAEHAPEVLDHPDEPSRCMAYWITWNRRLARHADGARPYVRYRVEDLTVRVFPELVALLGSTQPIEAVQRRLASVPDERDVRGRSAALNLGALPAGPLRDELFALADELGYQLVSA